MAIALAGCGTPKATLPPLNPDGASLTIQADWDDIDAAAEVGASQCECAFLGSPTNPTPRSRVYTLRHVTGRGVTLTITSAAEGAGDPQTLTLTAAATPLPDQTLERCIVQRVGLRLGDLRGKEFAPIRE